MSDLTNPIFTDAEKAMKGLVGKRLAYQAPREAAQA